MRPRKMALILIQNYLSHQILSLISQAQPLEPTCALGLVHAICGAAVSNKPGHSVKGGLECRDDHLLRTHIPFPVVWGIPSSLYGWLVSNPMPRSILAYFTPQSAQFCHPFQLSLYTYVPHFSQPTSFGSKLLSC
ncbi:uncharacterized protein BKA55DRAFT_35042 [Fusarium redolens]|jgi:hypothetical protein|uniref:Uncharacterized protein n=1 Tax=Fusarium redolens TaxID=48865 RepID=A0A9P9KX02_FUSRE|nr:uncharacterized protein BKA55DRAFT_35042 [Fusarium redolens]KAH7270148.1 hypothetical protein BKA55DRAFT_35042 [Fusarium redolens]